jgi:hypothetical protein
VLHKTDILCKWWILYFLKLSFLLKKQCWKNSHALEGRHGNKTYLHLPCPILSFPFPCFPCLSLSYHCFLLSFFSTEILCKEAGEILDNGSFTSMNERKRKYVCRSDFVSNIPDLEKLTFKCKFERKSDSYEWKAKLTRVDTIYLRNVTCERMCLFLIIPIKQKHLKLDFCWTKYFTKNNTYLI